MVGENLYEILLKATFECDVNIIVNCVKVLECTYIKYVN